MTHTKKRLVLHIIFCLALLLAVQPAIAGTITITECGMTDKTNGGLVKSGFAQSILSVEFIGEAECDCETPDLTYTWYFGYLWSSGGEARSTGATTSHTFFGSGAGTRSPYLNVYCESCGAEEDSDELTVHAISGIEITNVGSNWRLCFDDVRNVAAKALPDGVDGSDKIDYDVLMGISFTYLINHASGDLGFLSVWPGTNGYWGPNTLYASIDSGTFSQMPGVLPCQEGELNLTGPVSFLSTSKQVKVFFDRDEKQNPVGAVDNTTPNWFYYWTQTSANYGAINFDPASVLGRINGTPPYLPYVGNGNAGDYRKLNIGQNAATDPNANPPEILTGIDHFAWAARHEVRHQEQLSGWWPNGWQYAQDRDESVGDWIPDNHEAGLTGGPFNPNLIRTFTTSPTYDRLDRDIEVNAVITQAPWGEGSANGQDWARPGKQW